MLEGKVLELFNEWLTHKSGMKFSERELFYNNRMTPSMQFGVIQDFADSCGYQIYIKPLPNRKWSVYIDTYGHHILTEYLYADSRHQARTAAIEKLNELLNK